MLQDGGANTGAHQHHLLGTAGLVGCYLHPYPPLGRTPQLQASLISGALFLPLTQQVWGLWGSGFGVPLSPLHFGD